MAITAADLHAVGVNLRADVAEMDRGIWEIVATLKGQSSGKGGGGEGGGGNQQRPPTFLESLAKKAAQASVAVAGFTIVFDRMMSVMGQQLTRFVSLANPAAVTRFNIALDNAMSAMGRIFLPVLERFTAMIQSLGNAIESLSPQAKALIGALAVGGGLATMFAGIAAAVILLVKVLGGWMSIILLVVSVVAGVMTTMSEGKEMMGAFQGALKAVGTVIEILTQIFVVVFLPVIKGVAEVIRQVAMAIADIIRWLARQVGIEVPDFDPNKKQAMAVRQSNITDLKSFANRAYSTAFGGAASDVNGMILTENQKQTKILEQIRDKGEGGPGTDRAKNPTTQGFVKDVFERPGYTAKRIAQGAQSTFGDAFMWVRDRMRKVLD